MPAVGKRINIFVDPLQEEYLLRRSAEVQVARRQRFSPSQYVLELLDNDMKKDGAARVKDGADPSQVRSGKLRLPSSQGL